MLQFALYQTFGAKEEMRRRGGWGGKEEKEDQAYDYDPEYDTDVVAYDIVITADEVKIFLP